MEELDLSKFKTVEQVTDEMERRKDTICNKTKQRAQLKEEKKDVVKGYNETLKVLEEEVEFELATLDQLRIRLKEVDSKLD